MKNRICFVTTSSISIDSFILPMVPALEKNGFEVSFVTNCAKDFEERCGKSVHVYHFHVGRGFDLYGTFGSVFKFKRLCKSQKFDMVVFATPNGALYGSIGSWMAKVPCRILAQWGMRYVGFEEWRRTFIRSIEKISCLLATDVRNVSEKNRLIAIEDGMYKPEKCKVLGQGGTIGVDLDHYNLVDKIVYRKEVRTKYGISSSTILYGFVGRICKDKGVGELLQAFEKLHSQHEAVGLFLIGGEDKDSLLLPELLSKSKSNKNIIFCGQMPNKEVVKYLSACDVLVHPTYREGFGMVLQEAAALQLPTITTNIPGASEAIVDKQTGLLAEKQDVPTLVSAMEAMLDANLREQYGKSGRERIENQFERNMMINRIIEDYIEILDNRKKR